MPTNLQRVVVTGVGVASPLGCELEGFWQALLDGRSGVVALADPAFARARTRIGALATGFDQRDHFDRKELKRISRSSQLALVATAGALRLARLGSEVDPSEVGVIVGSSIGGFQACDPFFRDFYLEQKSSPLIIPVSMNVGPASNISIRHRFGGPLMNVDAACASAAHAVGHAFNLIRSGVLEVAITGGADSPFSPGVVEAWCALRALSERNEDPAHACRPFDAERDGLVLGEGAAILVIESEESALRRGATILGEILGYGASADGHHLTQPSCEGPVRAMRRALANAGMTPDQVDHVNAHGTATPWNDKNETAAIKEVFGERAHQIPVVSNKAALGHSIGASGALELVSCLLALRDQMVPPTINYSRPDPDCDLDYVVDGPRRHAMARVISNSFAFGGSNATLVVGAHR